MRNPNIVVVSKIGGAKHQAMSLACEHTNLAANILCIDRPSGVNAQPVGPDETSLGANNRAKLGQEFGPVPCVSFGIESGLFGTQVGRPIDRAEIIMLMPNGTRYGSSSYELDLPRDCVAIAKKRGFATTTVGAVIAEMLGGPDADPTDPHSILLAGRPPGQRLTRVQTLVDALIPLVRSLHHIEF